jgi:RNA 3'-terminal phosphate cyclase (ATP)
MLTIDGASGEGGGQILRSSLALSLHTGEPFRIVRIRAGRKKPGLLRQHLACVEAAAAISGARVEGARLGALELGFHPGSVRPGEYRFSVGHGAGSTTLILQSVLSALALAEGPSRILLEGGTHNPFAPPFDFLARAFLPLLARIGPRVEVRLERPGFYPAGGGQLRVSIEPASELRPLELAHERGPIRRRLARALSARLPDHVAERELARLCERLGLAADELAREALDPRFGPGNALCLELESDALCEVVTAFGERGKRAEAVADEVAEAAERYLASPAPVGECLCDQLLLPLALAGRGVLRTLALSSHARTNLEVIGRFLPLRVREEPRGEDDVLLELERR